MLRSAHAFACSVLLGGIASMAAADVGEIRGWGGCGSWECEVPDGLGTPENPVASVAVGYGNTVVVLGSGSGDCPGDLDGDGLVGGSDLGALFAQWGPCTGCSGDLDGDGVVGGGDLGQLFAIWGDCD